MGSKDKERLALSLNIPTIIKYVEDETPYSEIFLDNACVIYGGTPWYSNDPNKKDLMFCCTVKNSAYKNTLNLMYFKKGGSNYMFFFDTWKTNEEGLLKLKNLGFR